MSNATDSLTAAAALIGAVTTAIGTVVGVMRVRAHDGGQSAATPPGPAIPAPAPASASRKTWPSFAAAGVGVLMVAGAFTLPALVKGPKPKPSAQASASAPVPVPSGPAPSPSASVKARITFPMHDGEPGAPIAVSHKAGLIVRGDAAGLQDEFLWLFDFDTADGMYYQVSDSPIPVSRGRWYKQDAPIGDPGVRKIQYIVVIRADVTCDRALRDMVVSARRSDDEPFSFDSPPHGCVEDDRVPVDIATP